MNLIIVMLSVYSRKVKGDVSHLPNHLYFYACSFFFFANTTNNTNAITAKTPIAMLPIIVADGPSTSMFAPGVSSSSRSITSSGSLGVSGVSVPGSSVPGSSVPGVSVPGSSVPGSSVPGVSVPVPVPVPVPP